MPLETFTNPDAHLNVKHISAESPEQEFRPHFDPRRDLTQEDWKGMLRARSTSRRGNRDYKFLQLSSCLATIDRTSASSLNEDDWKRIETVINADASVGRYDLFLNDAARIFNLDPSKVPVLTKETWQGILSLADDMTDELSSYLAGIAMLDRAKLPELTDLDWQDMLGYLDGDREIADSQQLIKTFCNLMCVDPSRVPDISENDWAMMLDELGRLREAQQWPTFTIKAAELCTISRIEKEKWKAARPTGESSQPLPQTRKF